MTPVNKRDGDIQWRILHGAIASSRRLVKMSFHNTKACLFCNELEDLKHIFIDCPRILDLTRHLSSYLRYNINSKYSLSPCNWIHSISLSYTGNKIENKITNWLPGKKRCTYLVKIVTNNVGNASASISA